MVSFFVNMRRHFNPQEIIEEEEQHDELSQRKLVLAKAAAERIRDYNRIIVDKRQHNRCID